MTDFALNDGADRDAALAEIEQAIGGLVREQFRPASVSGDAAGCGSPAVSPPDAAGEPVNSRETAIRFPVSAVIEQSHSQ